MIMNGVVAGFKPEEIRDMIPKDTFTVFEGWQKAHSPKKPGADAPAIDEVKELAMRYG